MLPDRGTVAETTYWSQGLRRFRGCAFGDEPAMRADPTAQGLAMANIRTTNKNHKNAVANASRGVKPTAPAAVKVAAAKSK